MLNNTVLCAMFFKVLSIYCSTMLSIILLPPARFSKTVGGIVLGSIAISADVLPCISVAIKASFLKLPCAIYAKTILLNCF